MLYQWMPNGEDNICDECAFVINVMYCSTKDFPKPYDTSLAEV